MHAGKPRRRRNSGGGARSAKQVAWARTQEAPNVSRGQSRFAVKDLLWGKSARCNGTKRLLPLRSSRAEIGCAHRLCLCRPIKASVFWSRCKTPRGLMQNWVQTASSDGEGSANSSANSSANPSRSSSSLKLSELDGAAGVSADAVSQRLRALEPKEEVLDSPFAQLLALRSQAATLPPLPSSTLGRGALMPALANFQSQVSYSRSATR